jgi:protein tyrosine phosphatase (PTP) superfamily phosphohydrolase (DUF442 family)/ribosomal protein S18 acetylase RimI-like enzyme
MTPPGVTFSDVTVADFDELAALRIAAMRASLEQVGRFDPERARERLRKSFYPEGTRFIVLDGRRVGFYTFRHADDGAHLDHFYIHPDWQSRGIGSFVMRRLLAESDAGQRTIHLGALRGSESNRFYQRHGFTKTSEDEWDIYYVRGPAILAPLEPALNMLTDIYSFRAIGDRLGTAGQPTEAQLGRVRESGFEAVINLALPTSDGALANEGSIVTGLGMSYVHIPVDFKAPAAGDFRAFRRVMEAFDDRPVFVHCAANMRVSAFVFLYRVLCEQVPVSEAERDLHAIWEPDEVWSRFIREQLGS